MAHASDSSVQRKAEIKIIELAAKQIGYGELAKRNLDLPGGSRVEIDGATSDYSVLVEAFVRQGSMKGGQKREVALDVLKLITVRRAYPDAKLYIAFCDTSVRYSITGWTREAIETWEVERIVVTLDENLRNRLSRAQVEQYK